MTIDSMTLKLRESHMFKYMMLELRKNRVLFIGMAGTFLGSIPLAALVSVINHIPVDQGVKALLLFWSLAGLPGIAVLFGASAGAGLRSEPMRDAETLLPVSHNQRAGGALLAAGIYLGLLFLLFMIPAGPLVYDIAVNSESRLVQPFLGLMPFLLVYSLMLSFICAYVIGQGIVGGFLGIVFGGLTVAALTLGLVLQMFFDFRAPFTGLAVIVMGLALWGAVSALKRTAPLVERRSKAGWKNITLTALAIMAGIVCALFSLSVTYNRLLRSFYMPGNEISWLWRMGSKSYQPEDFKNAPRGILLNSLAGELTWIVPDGRRTVLIKGERRPIKDLLRSPWSRQIRSIAWDEDGSLWALRHMVDYSACFKDGCPHEFQLWHGIPGESFEKHSNILFGKDPYKLIRGRSGLVILAKNTQDDSHQYGALPPKNRQPQWLPAGKDKETAMSHVLAESGRIAVLSKDKRTLTQKLANGKVRRWELPGKGFYPKATLADDRMLFTAGVTLKKGGSALAVCRPDGKVELKWRKGPLHIEVTPNGTLWGFGIFNVLYIAVNGEFMPPLDLKDILEDTRAKKGRLKGYRFMRVIHADRSNVWMLAGDRCLAKLDIMTGKLIKRWRLPNYFMRIRDRYVHVVEDGFFLLAGRRLYFIGWDGKRRNLGPA